MNAHGCALHDPVAPEVTATLLAAGSDLFVPAGTLLFGQGDPADRFFLLRSGRVRLFVGDSGGGEAVLHVFGPGDMFGLPAMVGLQRYPVNGEALTDCSIAVVTRGALLTRLEAEPARLTSLLGVLGARWRAMARRLAELKALPPTQRVCIWLLRAAAEAVPGRSGVDDDGPVAFTLDVPHYVMAGAVGMAPENLSRAFQRLRDHGIQVRRREVRIESLATLRALALGEGCESGLD